MVGRTPRSAADAPVGLLALCMMLAPLCLLRDGRLPPTRKFLRRFPVSATKLFERSSVEVLV